MSTVVQASCPGCKAILRIPADWLGQPIRCKNCGTVLQAKAPAAPSAPTTAPAKSPPPPPPVATTKTPTPKQRIAPPPPPPRPATPSAKVANTTPEPIAPSAPPLAAPVAVDSGSPFEFEEVEAVEQAPTPRSKRRRKRGSWTGPLVALAIFALTGGMIYGVYTKVIVPKQQAAANGDPEEEPGEQPPSKTKAGSKGTGGGGPSGPAQFPRRAMIISVHNYLYANPIVDGGQNSPNLDRLISSLSRGLRIPLTQIYHVSDAAKKDPRPPLKSVIETSITNFLKTTRKQDRILLVMVGHTKEIENEAYFVPLEGEMDAPATLVPIKWIFEQLKNSPARQKILVLDGNRYNAAQGEERPSAGPMSEKFEEILKSPPAGVQVMVACGKEQQSQEFEESTLGVFLDSFRVALTPEQGQKGALEGRIQKYEELIPVDTLMETIKENMARTLERRKGGKQVAFMAGKPPDEGADYDRTEAFPQAPALPIVKPGDLTLVQAIMNDISLPPLKGGEENSSDVSFALLPPFPADVLKKYQGEDLPADNPLRQAVQEARISLWAVSTAKPPKEIEAEVKALRSRLNVDLSIMRDRYGKPGAGDAETAFKNRIFEDSRAMAPIVARLESVLDKLRDVGDMKENAPARWKANYDFILARFQAQLAYLEEYQGLLGQMRKDLPEHDPEIHTGFRMASTEKATDATGKKLERAARKIYGELAKENPQTPWEVLAKREKLTALGLTWKPY